MWGNQASKCRHPGQDALTPGPPPCQQGVLAVRRRILKQTLSSRGRRCLCDVFLLGVVSCSMSCRVDPERLSGCGWGSLWNWQWQKPRKKHGTRGSTWRCFPGTLLCPWLRQPLTPVEGSVTFPISLQAHTTSGMEPDHGQCSTGCTMAWPYRGRRDVATAWVLGDRSSWIYSHSNKARGCGQA